MTKWRKIAFGLLFGLILLEILVIFPNRLEKKDDLDEKQKKMSQLNDVPEQVMKTINLIETRKGHRDWELFAEIAEGTQKNEMWQLQKVKVIFYANDLVGYTVTGDRGQIDGKSKNMTIEGHVITKSVNGYQYQAEQVYYLAEDRLIRTPGILTMLGPSDKQGAGLKLTGTRMTVLVDDLKMKIDSEVRATKILTDQKVLSIQSESAEFNGRDNQAVFLGDVRLKYDKMEIKGPSAVFSYERATNFLDKILVSGGVQASDRRRFATADNISIDVASQKMVFRGHPRLVQDNDELNGEEIIFLDGGKKVKVERVRVNANESFGN